ncbi:MAG: preprotein translocase subunit YajC [Bacteroidetes bacterium]|nr:preprotein translocase subunit YajC [Bacteroidota bacterium]
MSNLSNILLMAQPQGGAANSGSGFQSLFFLLAIFAVFYFFMIRPQMKKTKEQKKFREQLEKGQKIVTIGGIHGKIVEIQETTVIIEVEGQNKLKIEKSAIALDNSAQLQEAK